MTQMANVGGRLVSGREGCQWFEKRDILEHQQWGGGGRAIGTVQLV